MNFSGTMDQENNTFPLLLAKLRGIGIQEIKLWKELVRADLTLFHKIYPILFSDNERAAWHAACIIDYVSEDNPELLEDSLHELITYLPDSKNSSVKRHITRILLRYPIPEEQLGVMVETSYALLSRSEAIAVRANALLLLFRISLRIPELKPELRCVVENMLESGEVAAIVSRGRKILKSLRT